MLFFALLMGGRLLSCMAQGEVDQMVLHLTSGQTVRYAIADVEMVTFGTSDDARAVDLGLSVAWASCNVGATVPEEPGGFYAWGETQPKSVYTEASYQHYVNDQYQYIGVNICGTTHDAATQAWGGAWRMPTRSELKELTTRCTWTPETLNGVSGYRVTAPNGNSIFLPAAGYKMDTVVQEQGTGGFYWTGSLDTHMTSSAYNINFRGYDAEWSASRTYGFCIRPVMNLK